MLPIIIVIIIIVTIIIIAIMLTNNLFQFSNILYFQLGLRKQCLIFTVLKSVDRLI